MPRSGSMGAVALVLCATAAHGAPPLPAQRPVPMARVEEALSWADVTSSPSPPDARSRDPIAQAAIARCGAEDGALDQSARAVAANRLRGHTILSADALGLAQRASGEPHPWARAWVASAPSLDEAASLRDLDGWLLQDRLSHRRRCGAAIATGPGAVRAIAVVAVEALADLAPLPIRARTGQWLSVEGRMAVPASGASVFLLGPEGPPRLLLTSFDGERLRARFAPDRPGQFRVQVVADLESGTRPVLEAIVFADVEPSAQGVAQPAPGESLATDPRVGAADDDRLARMLDAARATAGVPPLARDAALDGVAREHAVRMSSLALLAHDLGDGDPIGRLDRAGIDVRLAGENVAHAGTLAAAHRMLWASPSHRANIVRPEFDRVGLAVARDGNGDAWVVEEFSGQ